MSRRSALLELAVLGLLHETPMHGYELRKRLNAVLGAFRPLSYGTLYPCLRDLLGRGWITEATGTAPRSRPPGRPAGGPGSSTSSPPTGKDQFQALITQAGPSAWEDDDVRRALRLLLPHRGRGAAAHPRGPAQPARGAARRDPRRRGPGPRAPGPLHRRAAAARLDSAEREVRWLVELIETERSSGTGLAPPATPVAPPAAGPPEPPPGGSPAAGPA